MVSNVCAPACVPPRTRPLPKTHPSAPLTLDPTVEAVKVPPSPPSRAVHAPHLSP